jgi:two-component system response regulator AtoC
MLPEKKQILVVDDEANLRKVLVAQLGRDGYDVHEAEDGEAALAFLKEHHIDLVITDLRMPKVDGMELLRAALRDDPSRPVVMMTAYGTMRRGRRGAEDGRLRLHHQALRSERSADHRQEGAPHARSRQLRRHARDRPAGLAGREGAARFGIIGESPPINDVYTILQRVADTPTTVLITGESGTGKELVARALHENSSRRDKPFIKVNCAAIPKDLMESELFGYEKGAFTGAVGAKPGRFELASRARSSSTRSARSRTRCRSSSCASCRRASSSASAASRRSASTCASWPPPTAISRRRSPRTRSAKTCSTASTWCRSRCPRCASGAATSRTSSRHFITKFNARLKKNVEGIEPEAMERLNAYGWPGNIRELENVIERALLFADGARIRLEDLAYELRGAPSDGGARGTPSPHVARLAAPRRSRRPRITGRPRRATASRSR